MDPEYWNKRYNTKNDSWSLNNPNPVLVQVVRQKLIVPPGKLLVAGCGKGEDAVFLAKEGFEVTAVDFSSEAVKHICHCAENEKVDLRISQSDLLNLKEEFFEEFDLIYEYVTFCAIEPEKMESLMINVFSALKPGGQFITVLFPIDDRQGGPPFAIDLAWFYKTMSKYLKLEYYAKNINSVKPRKGNEILMIFRKEP